MATVRRQATGVVVGIIVAIIINLMGVIMGAEISVRSVLTGEAMFAGTIVTYLIASMAGGFVAIKVAGVWRWWLPGIIVAVLALGTVMNLTMMAHPIWFAPAAALALAVGYAASWRLTRGA